MSVALLICHGVAPPNEGSQLNPDPQASRLLVPEGRTVTFFAGFGEEIALSIGLVVVHNGVVPEGEKFDHATGIPNYLFSGLNDEEISFVLAAQSGRRPIAANNSTLYMLGAEILDFKPLPAHVQICSSPVACRSAGVHVCAGLFSAVDEQDIFIVCCRAPQEGQAREVTSAGHPYTRKEGVQHALPCL